MGLGEKIRRARKQCGLSQEQLAEKMCVSRSAIAKWETGKGLPDIENLKILSRLLGISVDSLLDDSDDTQSGVIRKQYHLSAYGRGCKKIKKDRMMRKEFPAKNMHTAWQAPADRGRPHRGQHTGFFDTGSLWQPRVCEKCPGA